jgi:5S rRNA maturation endonuclease (ribonuclease M5)
VLTDPVGLQRALLARFGRDRLLACGLLTVASSGRDFFLFNDEYNVVEPHHTPDGHVSGLQFRPSPAQKAKVDAHKAWKKRWSGRSDRDGNVLDPSDAWKQAYEADPAAAGEKVGYVTPFLSLRGGTPGHLLGCGLPRLARIDTGATVYVVEGFKDLIAARSLNVEAYAIPGTGVMPGDAAITVLRRHKVVVALDGDAAGAKGREAVAAHLREHGVEVITRTLPSGMDMADLLVDRTARTGCACGTCTTWRQR